MITCDKTAWDPPPFGTLNHLNALLVSYIESHSNSREGARHPLLTDENRESSRLAMESVKEDLRSYEFGNKLFAAILLESWPQFIARRTFTPSHPSVLSAYLELWAW